MILPFSKCTPSTGPPRLHVRGNQEVWGLWERLVPDQISDDDTAGKRLRALHLQRYVTAQSYVAGKRVLDLACGTGYGTTTRIDLETGRPRPLATHPKSGPGDLRR